MKIEIQRIARRLNSSYYLFRDLQLVILPGSIITIYTPESRGKSTLLRFINLEEPPDQGKIIYNDHLIYPGLKSAEKYGLKSDMSLMLQPPVFLNDRTVWQNLKIMGYLPPFQSRKPTLDYWLKKTQLFSVGNKYPGELSLGELQRLSFARALINRPSLILADQPFFNLDGDRSAYFQNLIMESRNQGTSWIITSHFPAFFYPDIENYHLSETGLINYAEKN